MTPPTVSYAHRTPGPGYAGSPGAYFATRRGSRGGVPGRRIERTEMDRIKAEIRGMSETTG